MTTIKLKNGSGAPTAGDLVQGEPALDLTNKRLYTEDSGGTVIEVGTNPTSITTGDITATGTATFANLATSGDVTFGDNDKAIFGAGSDLQIYHDGSHSYIVDAGTGNMYLSTNGNGIVMQASLSETMFSALPNGSVRLYHDNSQKLETTSTGIDVTGTAVTDGLTVGAQDRIYLDGGSNTYIQESAADDLRFFVGGSQAVRVRPSGTTILGTVTADDMVISNGSPTLTFYETDTTNLNARFDNGGGDLYIQTVHDDGTNAKTRILVDHSDGDISFFNSAGSSQDLYWDASTSRLGLGTTSPAYELDVNSTIHIGNDGGSSFTHSRLILDANGASRAAGIFSHNQVNDTEWFFGNPYDTPDSFAINRLATASHSDATANKTNSLVTVNSSGNVGIGLNNPTAPLTVNGNSNGLLAEFGGNNSVPTRRLQLNEYVVSGINNSGFEFNAPGAGGFAAISFATLGNEAMRIASSGNVGINNSNPDTSLHIGDISATNATGQGRIKIEDTSTALSSTGGLEFVTSAFSSGYGWKVNSIDSGGGVHLAFGTRQNSTTWSEKARLDASGNLLVGKTGTGISTAGIELNGANDILRVTRSGGEPLALNRLSSDGTIADFRKDGTTVGSIGVVGGDLLYIGTSDGSDAGLNFDGDNSRINPCDGTGAATDGALDLGQSGARFQDIYATNGTIQTSDRNEKQDIEELTEAEQRVAVACKGLLRKFRWKDAVEEKGDDARIHFGIIAQDLQDAFTAEGLDAGRYGMFINSTWTDEETGEERSRMGVRYSELLAFIISAI